MLDLSADAVLAWMRERAGALDEVPTAGMRPIEQDAEIGTRLITLGGVLDAAARHDPEATARHLASDMVNADLKGLLVQVGTPRRLRILHWLLEDDITGGEAPLRRLFEGDEAGRGQTLRLSLQIGHQAGLTQRVFQLGRLADLQRACEAARGKTG